MNKFLLSKTSQSSEEVFNLYLSLVKYCFVKLRCLIYLRFQNPCRETMGIFSSIKKFHIIFSKTYNGKAGVFLTIIFSRNDFDYVNVTVFLFFLTLKWLNWLKAILILSVAYIEKNILLY